MKLRIVLIAVMCLVFVETPASGYSADDSAVNILKRVSGKLESLKAIKYNYQRELNYSSEGYNSKISFDGYLDFASIDKTPGLRYQFNNQDMFAVFNGSESFDLNKQRKTITVKSQPAANDFKHLSFLYNSFITLKNALPQIIADDSIPKSAALSPTGRDFYTVDFILDGKTLDALGNYELVTSRKKFIYRLTVRRKDYLPVEILLENKVNKDYTKTTFSNLKTDPVPLADGSWFYSSYLNEYEFEKKPETALIKSGDEAPAWTLPQIEKDAPLLSLSQLKNKVTMLEFWISNCGYCIAAVPALNKLQEKYKDADFKLIAINADDSKKTIVNFKKRHRPEYDILYEGRATAESYGVPGFPTVVLIDRSGKIIYSGAFDESKIREVIDKNF